jgi:glycerophosphoryl diester phosphodiesterase
VVARFAFLDDPLPAAFAHRGGAREGEENTVAAFGHAVDDLGYRYVETDVHVTADGVVAVIHDPTLDRVTDGRGQVGDLPWSEVAAARTPGGEAVPRLDEVLAAWPDVRWNIDAKHDAVVEPLAEVLERAGAVERVCITSFSDRRLARVRKRLGPRLCTSMGPLAITGLRAASLAPALTPDALWRPAGAAQVPLFQGPVPVTDRRFVAAAHRFGLAVHVWTIDDGATMERLLDLGVDGIMTDRPTVLRRVLARRGAWGGGGTAPGD